MVYGIFRDPDNIYGKLEELVIDIEQQNHDLDWSRASIQSALWNLENPEIDKETKDFLVKDLRDNLNKREEATAKYYYLKYQSLRLEMFKRILEDFVKAASWFNKAANQGYFQAQSNLGDLYYYGFDHFSAHSNYPVFVYDLQTAADMDGSGDLYDLHGKLDSYEEGWEPPGQTPLQYLNDLEVMDSLLAIHLNHIGPKRYP